MFKDKKKLISNLIDVLLVVAIIIVAYNIYIKNNYTRYENDYSDTARFIYESNGFENGTEVERIIITRQEMNSLLTKPALGNDCDGYVIIYPDNQGPTYEAYVKCKDYISPGFDSKLLD